MIWQCEWRWRDSEGNLYPVRREESQAGKGAGGGVGEGGGEGFDNPSSDEITVEFAVQGKKWPLLLACALGTML